MPEDTPIRRRFADLLRESGRTQLDIARDAGLPQSLISGIATGARADLRAETVARLARALGLSATALGRMLYECHPENDSGKNSGL